MEANVSRLRTLATAALALAKPFPIEGMVTKVPAVPGLGIEIDEAKVARFACDLEEADRA
jgi:hypothetical protein